MVLPLNEDVLNNHKQKYANSCVPMGVELVLKLMGKAEGDFYELQDEEGDKPRWGGDYHDRIIKGVRVLMEFNLPRGPQFPLHDLFEKIKSELDSGRYVNCAWRSNGNVPFHAYVIYGYEGDEFLAVSKAHDDPNVHYIKDMKKRITAIQGGDILIFNVVP